MKLSGEQMIAKPPEAVFAALNDVQVLQLCIPGCKTLNKKSDTEMEATVVLKIGPVEATFKGAVTLSDINSPHGYAISGEGNGGVAGFAKGGAKVDLTPHEGGTMLRYDVSAQVGGKIAQLGSRLIDSTAKRLANQFFNKFGELLGDDGVKQVASVSENKAEESSKPRSNNTLIIAIAVVGVVVLLGYLSN
ncbi:carbon monoxide dehydrogenase subunit G [Candidatus Persebacteraceae bacterium Df01]|jgi:carbon monoxide dehydrogenase subunit G|uniref:Carbon monoxide dehydrogenase subunit G n=1 Tax=Candidatus Doriopsillibacter californiensis TaxID=2970740 RepID=A0ABT7QMU0_9GAMM|nr:carbon monoxide dehydrogenase subunit G [Candidatus Persebacteraceae bacterium Df01]